MTNRHEERESPAPLVSVVIPCYNHARYLGEALESTLAQTVHPIEVIVVDDGSTDDTAAVTARYPSVRYVHQANQGLSAARNTGLHLSRGAHIVFLDADDRLLPEALGAGLRAFEAAPDSAFVYGTFRWTDGESEVTGQPEVSELGPDPYLAMLRRNYISMHATVMYRRGSLAAIGGFATDLRACEDYDVFLRLTRCHPIHRHDEVVAEYRQHDTNMSGDLALMAETALAALRRQREHVQSDPQRRQAYWEGVEFWEMCYGVEGVRGFLMLARTAPVGLARRSARRAASTARRMAGRVVRRLLPGFRPPPVGGDTPSVGHVDFGDLRRVRPLDDAFGFGRGTPVDRYYIDRFLTERAGDVRGRVLEIKDAAYTEQFGDGHVTHSDVLDIDASNPLATVVADLADAATVPDDTYDCVILTQTLQLVYDVRASDPHRVPHPETRRCCARDGARHHEDRRERAVVLDVYDRGSAAALRRSVPRVSCNRRGAWECACRRRFSGRPCAGRVDSGRTRRPRSPLQSLRHHLCD